MEFVATNVYVVDCVGVTVIDPLVDTAVPFMVAAVAPVIFHDKVNDWPEAIEEGLAVKEFITGAPGAGLGLIV